MTHKQKRRPPPNPLTVQHWMQSWGVRLHINNSLMDRVDKTDYQITIYLSIGFVFDRQYDLTVWSAGCTVLTHTQPR